MDDTAGANPLAVIVCGGRDWDDRTLVAHYLDRLRDNHADLVVIEGGARGADRCAALWAQRQRTPTVRHERYPANWDLFGPRAGVERNQRMLDRLLDLSTQGYATSVLAFKDTFNPAQGGGTEHMVGIAKLAGISGRVVRHRAGQDDWCEATKA